MLIVLAAEPLKVVPEFNARVELSTVKALVVVPIVVDVNAFEPNSLVPTTPLPLIINEVASPL